MATAKKPRKVKPDLNSRPGKYFLLRQEGVPKGEAALRAGYPDVYHTPQIEKSKAYEAIEKVFYKDELIRHISLEQIAREQIKNILQDEDKGAKNKAIEHALSKLEPEDVGKEDFDKIVVVLKQKDS
jgi:hypothetical protein